MTQEEKAKRYEESLSRAKNLHKDAIDMGENIRAKQCEIIFPELKESEDERIRKDIIEMLRNWASVHYITKEQFSERMAWLEKQSKSDESLYIRFGNIPINGKSKVYNGEIEIGIEEGISVYPAFEDKEGNIILGLNLPITKTSLYTQQHLLEYDNRPCYLVTGDYVGKGTDGEPLLKNVRIIKEIKPYRIKQGEKPQGKSALESINEEKVDNANEVEPKFKVGDIVQYITDSTDRRKIEEIDTLCNMYHTDSLPIMFEIEDDWKAVLNSENVEQKIADTVEPKFKDGDWITNGEYTWKVISVDYLDYTLQNQWGECVEDTVDYVNKAFHLWTIQDAKDGDVIAFDNGTIVIFKDLYNSTSFHSYCYIECGIFDFNKDELPDWWEGEGFNPSTKEQSDILFQKIKEAGYEWDADKKELRKEEVK